ncbi:hypothetical protein ODJ79_03285 [Actinoplanes sp. KI2]|uniref:hypothetical protein n=1 Tax=Actinoplanes sp. KI2 TaxID=2983315 RepID=UPI0021D5FB0B|nr:hypothetical protein [Actinoplanes sp. KI2]MCU7722730.1 hypothetical protein [Actinoplanes sp. KI2]
MRFFNKTRTLGLAASLTVGLIAWVISGDAINALIVAVLGEIIALLIDLHLTVTGELEDFKRADALRSALPARGPNKPDLEAYVANYATVTKNGNALLAAYAEERMLEAVEEMHNLAEGHMEIGPEQLQEKGAQILRNLKVGGFATALGHLYDFWLLEEQDNAAVNPAVADDDDAATDAARRDYQRQSLEAVQTRKVPITRVFLLESREVRLPAEFFRLIDDQARAGVVVLVAYVDRIPENLVEDFAIWDDKLVARVSWKPRPVVAPNGEKIVTSTVGKTAYHTTPGELQRARRQRDELLRHAVRWAEVRSRHTS